jgi:hypothetical protein
MTTRGETYQGTPCKRGHSGRRYVKGGACTECQKITDTARRQRQVNERERFKMHEESAT